MPIERINYSSGTEWVYNIAEMLEETLEEMFMSGKLHEQFQIPRDAEAEAMAEWECENEDKTVCDQECSDGPMDEN